MAYDGTLKFDTKIISDGFKAGISSIGDIAAKGIKATTAILSGAAAAVGAIGTAAVKVGSSFEAGMSQVQAVSGASGDDLEQLKNKAMEMGAATKFSATESAEAMNYMAMAGWKTEQMLGGIEGIMNLAAAAGENLATTSDIVTDAMTAFGLSASGTTTVVKDGFTKEVANATHFADVLAAASSNANTNVSMLGESFKYVAPVAGAMGYSAEDTAIALGLMANAGIKASQGGTALRTMLTNLAKPSDQVVGSMMKLGISLQNDEGEMKSFLELITDMRGAFANCKMPMDEFIESVASLEEEYASGAITEKVYSAELKRLTDSAFTAEEALRAQEAATIAGMGGMSGLLAIVSATDEDFNKLTEAIYNCDGAAEEMAAIMQDNLQGAVVILQSGLEGLGVSIYVNLQEPLKDVVKEAQAMVQELQVAFNEGGLDGLVGAVGGVLAKVVQRIAEEAPVLTDTAVQLVFSFCEGLKNAEGLEETGAGLVASLVSGVLSCAGEMWSTSVVLFADFLSGMASQLPQIIETGKEAIAQFVQAVVSNAPSIFASAETIVSTLFEGIMTALPEITAAGVDILNRLAEGVSSSLPELIPVAMNALMEFSGSLRENVGLLVDAGLNLIMSLAQSLIDNIPVFIETVPTIVTNIAGIINDNAPKLLAAGIELIGRLAMGLVQAIPTLVSNIPQIIQAVVSVFTAFNWLSLGKNIITAIKDGVESLAKSLPTAIKNIGTQAKDWLRGIDWKTLGADVINFIVNGVKSLLTSIPELIKSIGHTAVEWFKSIDWIDLGINLVKGIIGGITGALEGLWDAVGDMCGGVLDGIKGFFGIHSPSTVMEEQGGYLVDGMIIGLEPLPEEAGGILSETLNGVKQWGSDMQQSAAESADGTARQVEGSFSEMSSHLGETLADTLANTKNWGDATQQTAAESSEEASSFAEGRFAEMASRLGATLAENLADTGQWGEDMLRSASDSMEETTTFVETSFSDMSVQLDSTMGDTLANTAQWGTDMLQSASDMSDDTRSFVETSFTGMSGSLLGILTDTLSGTDGWGADMLQSATDMAVAATSFLKDSFRDMSNKLGDTLAETLAGTGLWSGDMISEAVRAAESFVSGIVNGVSGLPGMMTDIGGNIVSGIGSGISSGWGWLQETVSSLAGSLFSAAKNALGIHSPSKVFADEVGQWIPPGIGEGMEEAMPDLEAQMGDEMAHLAEKMQAAVEVETGGITVKSAAKAQHEAAKEYPGGGDTYVEEKFEQHNTYNTPVATPSEVARTQREAARKLFGGVQ